MENTNDNAAQKARAPKKRWSIKDLMYGFVKNTLGKKKKEGNYSVALVNGLEALTYTAYCGGTRDKRGHDIEGTDTLAVRLPGGLVLANSSALEYVGSHMNFGHRHSSRWGGQRLVQKHLDEAGATSVPFSIFGGEVDMSKVQIIEKAPAEGVVIQVTSYKNRPDGTRDEVVEDEKRHYTGACLMKVGEDYYLFDIDRNELVNKIFNPFMVQMPAGVEPKTVAEAYDMLIPESVKVAKGQGVDVKRQGEWFFVKRYEELTGVPKSLQDVIDNTPDARKMGFPDIEKGNGDMPADESYKPGDSIYRPNYDIGTATIAAYGAYIQAGWAHAEAIREAAKYTVHAGQLKQGDSRPNNVTKSVTHGDMVLCSGTISHTGREHKDLVLTGWYQAIPNTAVGSWQITGDID